MEVEDRNGENCLKRPRLLINKDIVPSVDGTFLLGHPPLHRSL